MHAASNGRKEATQFLITRKANVNHKNARGMFALFCAAFNGHKDIVEILLRAGADENMEYIGDTAALAAAYRGHKDVAELIEAWGRADALIKLHDEVCVSFFVSLVAADRSRCAGRRKRQACR